MTARQMITFALQEIGAIAAGETPSAADAVASLVRLNGMLDGWQAERLAASVLTRSVFAMTASVGSYTIGVSTNTPAPDWAISVRPTFIQRASLLDSAGYETLLEVLTEDRWAALSYKAQTSTEPSALYYEPTVPNGTIRLWPVPTDATGSIVLYVPVPLASGLLLDTDVVLPPAYDEAIRYNLAVRLAPMFGRPLDQTVTSLAVETKATMKRLNVRVQEMTVDPALLGGDAFDIFTGGC